MLHQPTHRFEMPDVCPNAAIAFRREIRARAQTYKRPRHLPVLVHCPKDWLYADEGRIRHAIIRRLKLALYQQRQARAIQHYTFSQQKYEALLVAIGGELALARQTTKAGQHRAETDSLHPSRFQQFPV